MQTRKKRGSATPSAPQAAPSRASYKAQLASGWSRALRRLGIHAEVEVVAELEDFMKDFRAGKSDAELNALWDFKYLQGRDARRSRVKQIRVSSDYRVALIVGDATKSVWFLNAYRRASHNEPEIGAAVRKAKEIRKEIGE